MDYKVMERLRQLIDEKNVSLDDVSKGTGISKYTLKQYITNVETTEKMTLTNLFKLAYYFNVSAEYLCGDTDAKRYVFVCPDGDEFVPENPVYLYACNEFIDYLVEKKGFQVKEVK